MFKTFYEDRPFIERKYHDPKKPFDAYKRRAYHGYDYDPATGMTDEEIAAGLRELDLSGLSHPVAKARAIRFVLENTRIDCNEHDYFVGFYTWDRQAKAVTFEPWKKELFQGILAEENALAEDLNRSGAVTIWPDFDHVVPDWNSIMRLGFAGLRQRARENRELHGEESRAFFDGIEEEYTAVINFVDRLYRHALKQTHPKAKAYAECLRHLRDGAPTDIYEAMQLIFLYFMISESVDFYQVRSLGNGIDATLYPFYQRDLETGRYTREEIREFLAYFMMQWAAIGNFWGQPMYLGGTDEKGGSKINPLSHDIIEVYGELGLYNPKIQIKYNKNLPEDFLNKVLALVRNGSCGFVFCCEPGMMKAVMGYGATYEEARTMDIRGCYETGVRANEVSAATGYVNPLKAVHYALNDGYDSVVQKQIGLRTGKISSFEDFYRAFLKQYENLIEKTIQIANAWDPYMGVINPSSLYSATIETSLKNGRDGYGGGVKYNNSALLNCGLATAVDAILAVWEFVYEKKELSLEEWKGILERNWEGAEVLRAKVLNSPHKYGNGDPLADHYAEAISRFFCARVNGRKNGRGGVYKAILHSAMQFVRQGEKTQATPDGRKFGDEISKNASPTPGMDRNGVTALIHSATKLDPPQYMESFCLDVMLHPSTVEGERGNAVMKSLIDTYMERNGLSIQFNVFSVDTLREAQLHPEKYQNLQVRVCGWSVLWNNLSRREQDAYICRIEHQKRHRPQK
ncbi:MAG: hypothetical protein IJ043_07900 [Clostridia bacterium]|nr:hypothetical protein [Clostridia bacterium]